MPQGAEGAGVDGGQAAEVPPVRRRARDRDAAFATAQSGPGPTRDDTEQRSEDGGASSPGAGIDRPLRTNGPRPLASARWADRRAAGPADRGSGGLLAVPR